MNEDAKMRRILVILSMLFCIGNIAVASNKPDSIDYFSTIRYLEEKIDAPRIMGCVQDAIAIPSDTKTTSEAVAFLVEEENMTWREATDYLKCLYKYSMLEITPSKEGEKVYWDKIEDALYADLKAEGGRSDGEIHQQIAYALLSMNNKWERATVHFKKAVKLDPSLYLSWNRLGMIYIDTNEGNEYFRRAIEANPDEPEPYYWLAYTYSRFGKDKEALPLWEIFVKISLNENDYADRVSFAQSIIAEIRSGKEGKNLASIRLPNIDTQ